MESLPLMRMISDSGLNAEVDRRWVEVVLHQLGPDGLAYLPTQGRPSGRHRSAGALLPAVSESALAVERHAVAKDRALRF
jgi:hypothetical protein